MQTTIFHARRSVRSIATLIIAILLLGVLFPPTAWAQTDEARKIGNYRADLKTFMKLSKSDEPQIQRSAIYNLCSLHYEIVRDHRFTENPILQGFRVTIARRLEGFSHDQAKAQRRAARNQKKRSASSDTLANHASGNVPDQGGRSSGNWATHGNGTSSDAKGRLKSNDGFFEESLIAGSHAYHSMGLLSGGPSQMFNYVGGRFAPPWDHGPELVALIQNTINPDSWRVNGGQGAIEYFRPLRVLVIAASQRVHDDTLELLRKLRGANGVQIRF